MADRASVRVVGGEPGAEGAGAPPPSSEPEAQPPVAAVPPQEEETSIGGNAFQAPQPEEVVQATGGSIAERMRARFQAIAATEEFPVPGWELPSGEPGLILVARAFGDKQAFTKGVSNQAFIAKSTHKLLFVNDDGTREELAGGWGPALADIVGVKVSKAADLVDIVISKPDPDDPSRRIPNVAGIGSLAQEIVNWAGRGTREAEEDLGG